jgi:hypothetical protein
MSITGLIFSVESLFFPAYLSFPLNATRRPLGGFWYASEVMGEEAGVPA